MFLHAFVLLSLQSVASSCLDCHEECLLCSHVKVWELAGSPNYDFNSFYPCNHFLPFLGAMPPPFLYLLFSGSCQVWCPSCSLTECPARSPKPVIFGGLLAGCCLIQSFEIEALCKTLNNKWGNSISWYQLESEVMSAMAMPLQWWCSLHDSLTTSGARLNSSVYQSLECWINPFQKLVKL